LKILKRIKEYKNKKLKRKVDKKEKKILLKIESKVEVIGSPFYNQNLLP
jgi:hypothetical protein